MLPSESFVITSRDKTRCDIWSLLGWNVSTVSLDDSGSLRNLFENYPGIETVVDSVPPLQSQSDPLLGVKNVVASLTDSLVRKVIYLSTTGVFGRRDGSIVDEQSIPAPWNLQGESRWKAEQVYRESSCRVTALRLPAIYGPDRGVLHSMRSGTYRLIEDGEMWTNRIHVHDLAQAIVLALQTENLPEVLCISDDYPSRAKDVAEFICAREALPWPQSITRDEAERIGAYTMLSNQRVSNEMMKKVLHIQLRYPSYREGLYAPE
jgi:nucleoside-diphosphate-sugar epimerase